MSPHLSSMDCSFLMMAILTGVRCLHTSPARIVVFWWWPFWLVWDETSLEFDLHFSNNKQCRASCHVFIVHLYIFFGEISLVIYFIYSSVCMSIPVSQSIPLPNFLVTTVCFLHPRLYFYFVNKFICIFLIDSTYKWYYMIFVSLCLTNLFVWQPLSLFMLLSIALFCSFYS